MSDKFTDEEILRLTTDAVQIAHMLNVFSRTMLQSKGGIGGSHILAAAFLCVNYAQDCQNAGLLENDWASAARHGVETAIKMADQLIALHKSGQLGALKEEIAKKLDGAPVRPPVDKKLS
jgi:hypothetical protein